VPSFSGSVLAAVAQPHVGQLRVVSAVRFPGHRLGVAETETPCARFADRPAAGDHTPIGSRRRRLRTCRWWCRRLRRQVHSARSHGLPGRGDRTGTGERWERRAGNPARFRARSRAASRSVATDRRGSGRQIKPVRLADDRIFRDTEPPADLGSRVSFIPESPQADNRFLGPLHLVVPSAYDHKIRYTPGGCRQHIFAVEPQKLVENRGWGNNTLG
jgi:hypothetical protein